MSTRPQAKATTLDPKKLPPRPRLVLRVGFAGSQSLISGEQWAQKFMAEEQAGRQTDPLERENYLAERQRLERTLPQVLARLGSQLASIAPCHQAHPEHPATPGVAQYFAAERPLLRLITGLCEGADDLAADVLADVAFSPNRNAKGNPADAGVETELAAVLPFDVLAYRQSRPAWFRPDFDRQLERCAWVMTLDGLFDKPDPATLARLAPQDRDARKSLADHRRGRGYRAQAAFLLRHSDLLIAAANPDRAGRAGGTLETVREALSFELPVLFIHTGRNTNNLFLIEPDDDLNSALLSEPAGDDQSATETSWEATLDRWVTRITADPDSGLEPDRDAHGHAHPEGDPFLTSFFAGETSLRYTATGTRRSTWREALWTFFERRFRTGPSPQSDPKLPPFSAYRDRATDANYHFSGLYRGAFLLNYVLAIVAVALAAVSLTLLGTAGHTSVGGQIAKLLETAGHSPTYTVSAKPAPWLLPTLLILAIVKLFCVVGIWRNTRQANGSHWNELAVDFRYLAERLRGMYYLAKIGSHQPPSAEASQFASRVIRQSAVDWLFESIVRSISPADLPVAVPQSFPRDGGHAPLCVQKLIVIQPLSQVERVRDAWVVEQAKYHERTSRTMHALHLTLEHLATWLGRSVILIVLIDLVLIGGKVFQLLPDWLMPFSKEATPWLIFISAVLPAVIAALGGIRFQSECQRLAERSAVMRVLLAGKRAGHPIAAQPWTAAVGSSIVRFFSKVWYVLRAIGGRTPVESEILTSHGRWEQFDKLAHKIRMAQASPTTDPGSWSLDALRLTERVAMDFVHEAAEWTVLYAKEVADPG